MLFDTHFHVDADDDAGAIVRRAREAGVTSFALIGTNEEDSLRARVLARREEGVVAAVGLHPHVARSFETMTPFLEGYADPVVRAVGEVGLDYHYEHSPREVQRRVFARFLETAGELELPVVIHCREAFDDCIAVLESTMRPGQRFVFHSFTGTPAQAETVLSLGGLISFNGMVTFRRADNIRALLDVVPMDRLLLETDAPYLAPVPHRGKRNEPAYLPYVAGEIARRKEIAVEEIGRVTTANARCFFGLVDGWRLP